MDPKVVIETPERYEEFLQKTADSPERRAAEARLAEISEQVRELLGPVKGICEEYMLNFEMSLGEGRNGEVSLRYTGLPTLEDWTGRDGVRYISVYDNHYGMGWEAGNEEYWESSSRGC